jgi:hypothetical protein
VAEIDASGIATTFRLKFVARPLTIDEFTYVGRVARRIVHRFALFSPSTPTTPL